MKWSFSKKEIEDNSRTDEVDFDIEGRDVFAVSTSDVYTTIHWMHNGKPFTTKLYTTTDEHNELVKRFRNKINGNNKKALEIAWGVIANVNGGDWSQQSEEWRKAAENFRDNFLFKA